MSPATLSTDVATGSAALVDPGGEIPYYFPPPRRLPWGAGQPTGLVRCCLTDDRERNDAGRDDAQQELAPFGDLVLRTPPNWTAVIFFAMLGGLHLTIAVPSLLVGRYGYLSLILASIFLVVAAVGYRCRGEVALLTSQRRLRLRTGTRRFCYERFVPFSSVRAVRLTVEPGLRRDHCESLIELLCRGEDIPCPPTSIPRQQALFLAMAMNVPLIKVSDEAAPPAPERIEQDTLSAARTRAVD